MDLVRKSFTSRDQLAFQDTSFMANSCLGEVPGCVSVSAELLQLSAEGGCQTCRFQERSLGFPNRPTGSKGRAQRALRPFVSPFPTL